MSVCISVCLSVSFFINASINPCIHPCTWHKWPIKCISLHNCSQATPICSSTRPSVYLFTHPSICKYFFYRECKHQNDKFPLPNPTNHFRRRTLSSPVLVYHLTEVSTDQYYYPHKTTAIIRGSSLSLYDKIEQLVTALLLNDTISRQTKRDKLPADNVWNETIRDTTRQCLSLM